REHVRGRRGYVSAPIEDSPLRRFEVAGQQVEQSGLPRAVRADNGLDFTLPDRKRHLVDCGETSETFAEVVGEQKKLGFFRLRDHCRNRRHQSPKSTKTFFISV